ncbi:MAG TPA: carboxypeptidase-like regulatory domain-containing protein [Bacteroidales bacterium]|nr:carboxypeptidase-like regulatory domain-containing protein [Bacteroidales bacterium]
MWLTGSETKRGALVAGFLLLTMALYPQENILEKKLRLPANSYRAVRALNEVSKLTGYVFTYDTQILNPDRSFTLPSPDLPLYQFLDSVTGDSTIKYSVIGKHIILYREQNADIQAPPGVTEDPLLQLSGRVTDSETGEPLQYATIGISHRGKGTVTNNNGDFIMKVTNECMNDTLSISYVGYINRFIPVKSLPGNVMIITMERDFIPIPEIIIRAQDPQYIIRKAVASIASNYGTTPALLTGFYREGVYRKKEPQVYSEAVIRIWKSPYARSLLSDQIKVLRSRKIETIDIKDTLAVRLKAGLSSSMVLDGMRHIYDFIDPESMNLYYYHLTDIVTIDGENAYVIAFEQKEWVKEPLLKGEIYINVEDNAVVQAEFEINPAYIGTTGETFVLRLPRQFSMRPEYVRYRTRYRNIDGRYFLSHVRGDLGFIARGKNRLFNSRFTVFFELAVTNHQTDSVERFDRDELAPVYSVFSRSITGYDSEFWKDFDFLKPEDDLIEALSRLNLRLGEYGN